MLSGVMSILNNHPGGVAGLAQSFEQNGLGHLMSSWIGPGENLPISPDQVKSVLGNERVAELAAKAGISSDAASSHLAELLPNVIDKLSPEGKLPEGGSDFMSQGMSLLGGLFSKGTYAYERVQCGLSARPVCAPLPSMQARQPAKRRNQSEQNIQIIGCELRACGIAHVLRQRTGFSGNEEGHGPNRNQGRPNRN